MRAYAYVDRYLWHSVGVTDSLMLLDGASLWFRSFYALPEKMTAPDGRPVNAVRGFLDTIANLVTRERPTRLVVCLDLDWRPSFLSLIHI